MKNVLSNLFIHPTCFVQHCHSLHKEVPLLFHFHLLLSPMISLPLLSDLLLQIVIQRCKCDQQPTLPSEHRWNLTGPPLWVQLRRPYLTQSALIQSSKEAGELLACDSSGRPALEGRGVGTPGHGATLTTDERE